MKRAVVVALALVIAGVLAYVTWGRPGAARPTTSSSGVIALTCAESAGQQGREGTVVNGVEGLVLPGSGNSSSLTRFFGPGGRPYYVYKVFLAVSPADATAATVSVVSPASARLYYGPPLGLDASLVRSSKPSVRLAVCGARFTGYAGGVILDAPAHVTFQVTTPGRPAARVEASIGDG